LHNLQVPSRPGVLRGRYPRMQRSRDASRLTFRSCPLRTGRGDDPNTRRTRGGHPTCFEEKARREKKNCEKPRRKQEGFKRASNLFSCARPDYIVAKRQFACPRQRENTAQRAHHINKYRTMSALNVHDPPPPKPRAQHAMGQSADPCTHASRG
ncbi:hypothetical protein GW17_00059440, partial [Ensete ventricosum]